MKGVVTSTSSKPIEGTNANTNTNTKHVCATITKSIMSTSMRSPAPPTRRKRKTNCSNVKLIKLLNTTSSTVKRRRAQIGTHKDSDKRTNISYAAEVHTEPNCPTLVLPFRQKRVTYNRMRTKRPRTDTQRLPESPSLPNREPSNRSDHSQPARKQKSRLPTETHQRTTRKESVKSSSSDSDVDSDNAWGGPMRRRATAPSTRTPYWEIWNIIAKNKTLHETAVLDHNRGKPNTDSLDEQLSHHYNFKAVYRIASSKVVAGMYNGALQFCHDVLVAWSKEAENEIGRLYRRTKPRCNSCESHLRDISSLRESLAGMWCVYSNILVECALLGTRQNTSTLPSNMHTMDAKVGPEVPKAAVQANLIEHAIVILGKMTHSPIVGNHPWLSLALTRIIMLQYIVSFGGSPLFTNETSSMKFVLRNGERNLPHLQATIGRAIHICIDSINNSRPVYGDGEKDYINDALKHVDVSGVLESLSQCQSKYPILEDTISSKSIEISLNAVISLLPTVRQAFTFIDRPGVKILCAEVNRLSQLQKKVESAVSARIGIKQNGEISMLWVGFDDFLNLSALDFIDNGSVASGEIPCAVPRLDAKCHAPRDECDTIVSNFPLMTSEGEYNRIDVEEGSSSESTPVLIVIDSEGGRGAKESVHHQRIATYHAARSVPEMTNNCDTNRVYLKTETKLGSACSHVEYACSICLFAMFRSVEECRAHELTCKAVASYPYEPSLDLDKEGSSSESTPVLIVIDSEGGRGAKESVHHQRIATYHAARSVPEMTNNCDTNRVYLKTETKPGSACSRVEYACSICLFAMFRSVEECRAHELTCKAVASYPYEPSLDLDALGIKMNCSGSFDPERGMIHSLTDLTDVLDYTVELFTVTNDDLKRKESNAQNAMIDEDTLAQERQYFVGQVGLRCLFCRESNHFGVEESFRFPKSFQFLHEDVWLLCLGHLDACTNMPMDVRRRYMEFRERVPLESAAFEEYWKDVGSLLKNCREGMIWHDIDRKRPIE